MTGMQRIVASGVLVLKRSEGGWRGAACAIAEPGLRGEFGEWVHGCNKEVKM